MHFSSDPSLRVQETRFSGSEEAMKSQVSTESYGNRHSFIGGSDARIILGDDEAALLRLWREKRGEIEPEDLSGNLLVRGHRGPQPPLVRAQYWPGG
jgi:hypothetical protein